MNYVIGLNIFAMGFCFAVGLYQSFTGEYLLSNLNYSLAVLNGICLLINLNNDRRRFL